MSEINYKEFSAKIKSKYPQYANIDDLELAKKIVEKYPEYADQVLFDEIPTDEESVKKAKEDVYGVSYKPDDTAPEDNRMPSADNLPETLSYKEEDKETVPNYFGLFDRKGVADTANKLGVSVGFFDKVGEAAARAEYAPEKLYEAYEIKRKAEALKKHFPEIAPEADSILTDLVGTSPNKLEDISSRVSALEGSVASYVEEQPTMEYRGYINDTYDDPLSMATKRMIENTKNLKKTATEDATTAGRIVRGTGKGIQQYVEGFTKIVQEMASNRAVVEINNKLGKVANGEDVKFTEQEKMFLQVMVDNAKIQDEYGKRIGTSYKIGEAFGQSLGFMAEFVMTGGIASGATKLGQGAKVVSKAVQIGRATKVGKVATNMAIKAAQAGVQTLGMPSFYQKVAVGVSNGNTFGDALLDSYWQMWAENMSERIFMSKVVPGKEGANVLDRMLGRMGTTMTTEKGVLGVLKSTLEESAEEKIGEILTAPKDHDSFKSFWKSFTDVEQNKIMLGSVSLMTGLMGAPVVALNAYDKVSTGIKADQLKSVLDADVTSGIDKIYAEKDLNAKDAMSLVFDLINGKLGQLPPDADMRQTAHDALSYAMLKAKQTAMGGISEKEYGELVAEKAKAAAERAARVAPVVATASEEQSKVDYLKSRGQVVPDGTDMKTLEEMFSAEKTKERTEVNTEIDTKVKKAQEELGLPDVPNIEISEDTEATLDRLDEGLPVTNEYIESASQELYDRYRELEAMKSSDTRLYTTEQIDDMQGYLGEEIERLENYASEQKETGEFVGEVKGGEVAEGKAEGVAEGVREEVKEEPVQKPEMPVEAVSPKAEQVAPTEEKVAVKAADEVVVSPSNVKQQQFDVIQQSNPITDDVHTGIRKVEDIKTAEEVFSESISKNEGATPDFTADDMKSALESGEITVYSSKEIADGVFVTPSKMEAKSYAGKGKVYSKKVALADVAWVDNVEGQYAKVKLVKEEKKESDDKKTKRRLQRVDKQPAADGKPIVGKGETSPQGARLVDGAVVKAGDEVFYNGEKRKVKAVKGDVLTIPGVGDVHKSKVLSSAKIVQDKRPLDLNDKNPDNVNDDLLSDEVFDRIRKQNIEPTDVEVLSTAALAKSLMNGDISADAAIDAAVSRFADRGTVPDHVPFFKAAPGAKYTSPYATYNDAVRGADNAGKNLWVRNTPFSTNKQRVLLVQFSSNFLYGKQPFKRDKNMSYFDKLYRLVAGYNRTVDFWEVPLWIARIAGLQRNADVYVIRDIEEAKKFINEAGYASVHFSALDVNEKHIVDVIQSTPGVKYQIGGYTDFKRIEALPDVTVYKSIDEYVEKNKLTDIDGTYSYRHFKGTAVIPRLKLSEGCLYKCAFCSIPKKVIPVKKEWIDSQIESIKDLDATLVYLDDKTFGQAENYTLLPELYERIKEYNPDFKGFIVQTTALDFANKKKFGTEYLKNSHIQFVELGVETYNDDILTKLNKRHSHKKFVDAAMENARENNIKVIPNIIVGLSWNEGTKEKPVIKTETKETYQNTLDFLENNKDIISHVNVYSLALYEGTELSDAIEVKEEADKNENIIAKSWQQNKEDHVWAMDEFSDFASNQIKEEKKDEVQKEEKGLRDEKVNARFKKIAKQTGTDVETVTKMYDTLMSVFGLSQDKALAAAVIVDRMVDTMAKRRNKTKADIYASIKWEKGGATAVATGIKQDVLGKAQGAVTFLEDATAVIQALTNPNVTTPMHELAHVFEKYLTAKEKESVLKWTNEKSWSTNTSESFARGFERFLYDGTAPANLKSIFQKFAAWLRDIYKSITLSEIKLDLNDDMRKIYSAMLGAEYKGEVVKETKPVAETTAESEADAFFGNLAVDENGVTVLSDEEIADDFFSKLEVDENGYTLLQMIGTVGAARLDAAENNNNRIFNLREAMKMTDANKTASEIKLATGWEKGKDKRWRYEIPPTMKIKKAWDELGVSALDNKQELSITEAIDYPELFAAYPELEKIKIRKDRAFLDIFQSIQGWYNPEDMELVVAPHAIDPFGTILHELQHAVQMVEGFAAGANTDSVIEAIPDFEFENVVDQIVEELERDIKKNTQKNLDRRKILSEMTSQEEADIRRYSKEIIAAKEEGDRIYEEEKAKFPDKNPYKDNKRLLELTEVKTDLRNKINDIIERIIGERSITLAIEFAYGIEAVEEVIEETTNKIIEDNKSVRVIESGADRKTIIDNFRSSIGDMAYNYYKRVAGETEARNVAARAKLTPEQRKSTAESTEDIPRDQQIVMRGGKIVSMDSGKMTVVVDGKNRPVLNSEGRPIHNTEEGIINFWKWFGDSKVVNGLGRPLVVYHGQPPIYDSKNGYKRIEPEQITEFSNEKRRFLREGDVGFYFTPNKKDATDYAEGGSVYSLYIRSDNPILWKTEYHYDGIPGLPKIKSFTFLPKNSVNDIISAGYDGIMSISGSDVVGYNGEVVVFSSAQIKSATGNVGTFSGETGNILFQEPKTERQKAIDVLVAIGNKGLTKEEGEQLIRDFAKKNESKYKIPDDIIKEAINGLSFDEETAELGLNKATILKLLGSKMYEAPVAQVAVKELLQNSFDAVKNNESKRGIQGIIGISVDYDNRTIEVSDNGNGMTPDILRNAFLQVGGTNKEGLGLGESSGGFGLAKVQFLLASERVEVSTTRDGLTLYIDTTNVELYGGTFKIKKVQTGLPNGTVVKVTIPESYTTFNGESRNINFPGEWYSSAWSTYSSFNILTKPLVGDVTVNYTMNKNGRSETIELPLGNNQSDMPPLFTKIKFDWGEADLYMSEEKAEYPKHTILSSGIFQFDDQFEFRERKPIPYNIIVNIKAHVKPTDEMYPFTNQREGFSNPVKADIAMLGNYLRKFASGEAEKEAVTRFSGLIPLQKKDVQDVFTAEDVEAAQRYLYEFRMKNKSVDVPKDYVPRTSIIVNKGGVYAPSPQGNIPLEIEKEFDPSFKAEKEIKDVAPITTEFMNPDVPQYINNTSFDFLQVEGAAAFFTDLGNVVFDWVRFCGEELGYEYARLKSEGVKHFAGVSIDKEYGGVNVRKIIDAIFVNPLYFDFYSVEEGVGVTLHVMKHEVNHEVASGEGEYFTGNLAVLDGKLYATGKLPYYERLLRRVYENHLETYKKLKYEFDKSSTRNVSESLKSQNIKKADARAVQGYGENVPSGRATGRGYKGDQKGDQTGEVILSKVGGTLFEQPLTNREMAVQALANLAKNETTAEGARARIVSYLASRGRRLGIDEGNIISDAISRLGLSEAVVEPVRRAPSNPVPGERLPEPVGGKTKKSKLGLRLISGHSAIPEEVKRLIENNRLHEYRVLSHEEGQRIAKELYDENGLIDSYNAFFNTRMHSALEVYFGANIIMGMKQEIEQAEKDGRIADADYWSDQLVDFSGKYIKQVSVERAQGLNALGSAFIQSLFPSRAFVRKYIMGVNDARAEVLNSKPFKKKAERAKKEFEEERNAVVKTVIDELEEKVKKIKGGASLRELMSEKNRLLKELELRRKGKTKMQLSVPSIPGLDPVEVAYGVEFASLYIQGGVYGEKLIDRLIKDFGKIGIDLTEEQAEQMIPERMMVNGVEVDTRDVVEANETAKAAKRLANRIFGSVIEKKESADPLTVMLNTLMSKFNERNIKKPGSLKVPVIDKIAEAIKNKAMYADIWLQAKEKALSIIENNKKLSEKEKTRAKQLVKDSYDNATKFTFTEKQIDEAIKGKMKELNIVIRDIVSAHFDVRSQHMGTITNALIIDADLTEEEAKELGEAINRRYNTLMAERGKKLLERYTKHLTKEQRVNTTRKKDEDRLLELINIGAFNDPEFVNAFANARGMKKIDPEEIKAIEAKAEEVQRQKSPKIRARKLEDLLGYMAKIEGVTLSDKLEALWFAQVLGRIPTQLRNMIGAGTGVGADAATMLITNPVDAIPSTLNSLRRAFTFGKNSAGDVIRNGYTSYIQKVEVPRVAEFLHMNPEKFYKFARFIPFYWNHMKYVSRVMGANDVFFMTTAKEVWADVLTRRGVLIDGKKYSRYKYLFDGEYRDAVEQIVKEKLFITKEQMDAIKAEVAADAITYGYTTSDMKIATMEAIDMLRPADLVETSTWLASTATGNVPTYGTLGFLTDRLAETLKNIGLRRPQKTESGDYIWVKWRPFYYAATFTKITSNVVSRMMEFVPGLGIMRWVSGSVGFFYKDEYFLGANSNKFARYYRELSKEERDAVGRRQIIGALFTLAMYFLSDPGDDDDPLVRITANGTGDYAKNKSLDKADWKEYSVGIKSGEGRIWIPYKLTPLALVLAPLGWMRDKKRHNKKYENVPDAAMFLKGLQWMPYFMGDITAIMSMNEVLNGLFSEKSMRDLNAFVDDGEIAVSDKSKSFVQGFLNNIVKSFTPTLKGFYTPMLYPDIVKMWEWWTERELDMEKNEFKRLVNLFPTMAFSNKDEGMIYMDVLGRESKRPFFLSEFFDFKKSDDILVYHAKNADQLPATQWGSKMFDIYEGNNLISRTLDPTDKKDEELMWYYSKRRAEYLLKGVDSNEGYIIGMEALKAYGITGDLYQESVKKLDYAAQQAAKKDVTDVSMYELEFLRTQIGR